MEKNIKVWDRLIILGVALAISTTVSAEDQGDVSFGQ
jgi:hypothetical protein